MELTLQQRQHLVSLLLNCPSVQDRIAREHVLACLTNQAIVPSIPRSSQDRGDIMSIVSTCHKYSGALDELIEGVQFFENNSLPMQELERFWQNLKHPNVDTLTIANRPNLTHSQIEETLCKTDFRRALDVFQGAMNCFGGNGGAALFLLQRSYPMGAQWLIKRIDGALQEIAYPIHTISIGFESGMLPGEYGVLQRLAEWFPPQPTVDQIEHYTQEIIRRICTAAANRRVILIQLSGWDRLQPQERMLTWFVQEFWTQLVDELERIIAEQDLRRVRIIAVILTDTQLPDYVLTPHLCDAEAFASKQILSLPLEHWTLHDIQGWLEAYSHLRTGSEIDNEAQHIYEKSMYGIPRFVGDILLEQFAHTQEQ